MCSTLMKLDILLRHPWKKLYSSSTTFRLLSSQKLQQEEMVLDQAQRRARGGVSAGGATDAENSRASNPQNVILKVAKVYIIEVIIYFDKL